MWLIIKDISFIILDRFYDKYSAHLEKLGNFKKTYSNFIFFLYLFSNSSWITSSARLGSEGQLSEFIEGLGPGQLVGRQVLASPALGEIQLSLCDRRGHLEVEVIRARGLQCKPGSKVLPGKVSAFLRAVRMLKLLF